MPSSITFVLFEVLLVAAIIQGQHCPRTNPDRSKVCSDECLKIIGCSSKRKECICDGDCGYSCIKTGLTCKKPRKPTNGLRFFNGRKFNDTATFTCHPGFQLSGSSERTCRGKGVWDGIEAKCGKNCTDPGIGSENTLRREPITGEGFKTSEVLHYHCKEGYHIEGQDSITCQADGSWDSSSPPQCYRTVCPPPNLPNNSVVYRPSWFNISQGAKNGTKLILGCDPGYYKVGTSQWTCLNDRWHGPASFKCLPRNCGDPGVPRNGGKDGLIYHFKSKVTFYCDKCYKLIGASYRVCNADQTWSDDKPVCQEVHTQCKSITSISNGKVAMTSRDCGGKARFSCNKGHNLIGSREIFCNKDGQWSKTIPHCEPRNCGDPGVPRNGGKDGLIYHFKSKVTFYCDKCYKLIGASYRVCNADQTWSDQQPVCQEVHTQCKSIASISSGKVAMTSRDCGGKASFSCNKGHNLIGSREIFCNKDGQWSETIPHCEPVPCMKFNTSEKVDAVVSAGYRYGSTAKFSCKGDDYFLNGSRTISCTENGEWSGTIPECLAPCHVKPSSNLISVKSVYKHGEEAQLKCQTGFTLLGVIDGKMPRCIDGSWGVRRFPCCKSEEVIKKKKQSFWQLLKDLAKKLPTG